MEQSVNNFFPMIHMDNVLLSFLKSYFKFHPKYGWDENDSETKLKIIDQYSEEGNENTGDSRIIIRRGNFSMTSATLGANRPEQNTLLKDWSQKRQKMYVAGAIYSLGISSRIPEDTLDLAEEVITTLLMYKERITEQYGIDIKEHIEASTIELSATGRQKDFSVVNLTLATEYRYHMSIDILPRYEVLKTIDVFQEVNKTLEIENKLKFESLKFKTQVVV